MPFEKEKFNAGVEADEETDPKKFIQQLAGKLATSLRQYQKETGRPDFELEKFTINSVVAATNTSEMADADRKDIIKKINTASTAGGDPTQGLEPDMGDNTESSSDDIGDIANDNPEPEIGEAYSGIDEILGMQSEPTDNITKTKPELNAPTMKTNFRTKGNPFTKPKYIPR